MTTVRSSLARTVLVGALALGACTTSTQRFEAKRHEAETMLAETKEELKALNTIDLPTERKRLAAFELAQAQDSLVAYLRKADSEIQSGRLNTEGIRILTAGFEPVEWNAREKRNSAQDIINTYTQAKELVATVDSLVKSGAPLAEKKATLALRDTAAAIAQGDHDSYGGETLGRLVSRFRNSNEVASEAAAVAQLYHRLQAEAQTPEAKDGVEKAYQTVQIEIERNTNPTNPHSVSNIRFAENGLSTVSARIRASYTVEAQRIWEKLDYDAKTNTVTPHYFVEGTKKFDTKQEVFDDGQTTFEISRNMFDYLKQRGYSLHDSPTQREIVGIKSKGAINPTIVPPPNGNSRY